MPQNSQRLFNRQISVNETIRHDENLFNDLLSLDMDSMKETQPHLTENGESHSPNAIKGQWIETPLQIAKSRFHLDNDEMDQNIANSESSKQDGKLDRDRLSSVVDYVMLTKGTKNGRPKLYDSLGFSYIIRTIRKSYIVWQCVRCNGWQKCQAYVKEIENKYVRSKYNHHHPSVPAQFTAAKTYQMDYHCDSEAHLLPKVRCMKAKERLSVKKPASKTLIKEMKAKTKLGVQKKQRNIPSCKKSSYVEVKDESEKKLPPKLIDAVLGFSYQLNRTSERTKLWLCIMSETDKKCEASVKQVGSCFIRSRLKHTHKSNQKDVQNKRAIEKKMTQKVNQKRIKNWKDRKPARPRGGESSLLCTQGLSCFDGEDIPDKIPPPEDPLPIITSPQPLLSSMDKNKLVGYMLALHQSGLALTSKVLMDAVKDYFDAKEEKVSPNTSNRPSRGWVTSFIENHNELKDKYMSNINDSDFRSVSTSQPDQFYSNLEKFLRINHKIRVRSFLSQKNSYRIFNCDSVELVVNANASTKQFIPLELGKNMREEGRRTMNVLCCICADGHSVKPLIVNKGDNIIKYERRGGFDEKYDRLCSADGEITKHIFFTWLVQYFTGHLNELKVHRPVVLLLNGHKYVSYDSWEFAHNNGIILYHFLPYTARTVQPLSVSIFPALRKKYQNVFDISLNYDTNQLPQRTFPSVFMKAYNSIDICGLSKCGFKETGLCPWNPKKLSNKNLSCNNKKPWSENKDSKNRPPNTDDNVFTVKWSGESSIQLIPSLLRKNDRIKNSSGKMDETSKPAGKDDLGSKQKSTSVDKFSLKNGYKLALDNVEKLFSTVVDPSVLSLYKQKFEANTEYPDTTFLVWRGLQHLRKVPDLL